MPITIRCPNPTCLRELIVPDREPAPAACPECGIIFPAAVETIAAPRPPLPRRLTDTAPPRPNPTRIGRFELRTKLGAGAFGTVYSAHDPQLDRAVALKVPNAAVLADPGRVERFVREAKAVANLRHPNIVPVYEAGQDGGRFFIASALIDGQPLSDAIPDGGADFHQAAEWVRQLADALAYAHSEGVVHRDVKPANAILDRKGNVHLTDFGLARRSGDTALPASGSGTAADGRLTNDGDIVGTPAYMAPEQAAGKGGEVGPAADQYALGVVLYELIAGRTPFGGPPAIVLFNLLNKDPDPPSEHRRGVSKDLEAICRRAMAREPEERYKSCRQLADDLRRFLDGDPIAGRELTDVERMFLWARRRPTAAGASVLGVVVVLLIVSISVAAGLASQARQGRAFAVAERDAAYQERDAVRDVAYQERDAASRERDAAYQERDTAAREQGKAVAARDRAARAQAQARADGIRVYAQAIAFLNDGAEPPPGLDTATAPFRGWEWQFVRNPRVAVPQVPVDRSSSIALGGHTGRVASAAFNPRGSRVVTASDDRTARVWDATSGRVLATLEGHAGPVSSAAFSPDGARVVTASSDRTARVWEAASGKPVFALAGHTDWVQSAAFSPDGARVVTASSDRTARVWDATTGRGIAVMNGHTGPVYGAVFSPSGSRVVTACGDRTARVWEAATGKAVASLAGHTDWVQSAAFSPDGARVVTASRDKTARVWDSATGRLLVTLAGHTGALCGAAFSPDGLRVVTGAADNTARVWEAATGKAVASLAGHTDWVQSAAFSPDGEQIITASTDRTARVWNAVTGLQLSVFRGHTDWVQSAMFSPDGSRLLTASNDQTTRVWRIGQRQLTARFRPDTSDLVVEDDSRQAWLVKLPSLELSLLSVVPNLPGLRTTIEKSRDLIVDAGRVKLRDSESGVDLFTLPQKDVIDATFSPDGHWIATVGKDGSVRLYDGRPEPSPAKSP